MSTSEPPLFAGQQLTRKEFHARYAMTTPDFRAELIGGVVHVGGRVGRRHGVVNAMAIGWLGLYQSRTPGLVGGCHSSTALDDLSEVHPDALLRVRPDWGGQTCDLDGIIGGAPELILEVADETRDLDLGAKLAEYERAGTLEYIVLTLDPDEVHWHVRSGNGLVPIVPDSDGLFRSQIFPGLWLDPATLHAEDDSALVETLERGLAASAHAAFVAHLGLARIFGDKQQRPVRIG